MTNGSPKRGGRTARHPKDKKQAIYLATLKTCHAKGIGNATTAEIASTAGIAAGTLFYYHPNKCQLFEVTYKKIIVSVTNFVNGELANMPQYNSEGLLRQLWWQHVQWYRKHPLETNFLAQINNIGGEVSPYIGRATIAEMAAHYDVFRSIFQKSVEKEIVRSLPPALLLRIYIANAAAVGSLFHGKVATFMEETPQILTEFGHAAWNMIANPINT